ncbi:MAG: alpha/beta hydrolase [Candidatus Aureabacteria bacterium]|nr:alpha/beta hydrolase [Candidatus Auribacterota bacterium]
MKRNKKLILLTITIIAVFSLSVWKYSSCSQTSKNANSESKEYVVLLHGLGRTSISMKKMEKYLNEKGYIVINFGYASVIHDIDKVSIKLDKVIKDECKDTNKKINFVTHSLGGIVVRYYLKDKKNKRTGRVVMLAPPNKGSEIADWLKNKTFCKWIAGPTAWQLGTDPDSIPMALGNVQFDLGVIAGNKSVLPFLSSKIPGEDDGAVSVERAKVSGMKDFIKVHSTHTFIMNDKKVQDQVDHFFRNGMFKKNKKDKINHGKTQK